MEARKNISEQMKKAARNAELKPFEGMERVWERVAARLDEEEPQEKPVAVPFFGQRKIAAIAAGLLLMIGLGAAYLISGKKEMPVADHASPRVAVPHAVPSAGTTHEAAATFDTPVTSPVATPAGNKPVRVKVIRGESIPGITQADGAAIPEPAGKEAPYEPPAPVEPYIGGDDLVAAKSIESTPVSDITKAIEDAAPGVQVTRGSGQPGSSSSIQIRGRGSLSASTNPLIIVDGAPYVGDITSINPADVASMSILKDAQATSLYGARASNGVIVIVTKKADTTYKADTAGTAAKEVRKKKHKIWNIRSWFRKAPPTQ